MSAGAPPGTPSLVADGLPAPGAADFPPPPLSKSSPEGPATAAAERTSPASSSPRTARLEMGKGRVAGVVVAPSGLVGRIADGDAWDVRSDVDDALLLAA